MQTPKFDGQIDKFKKYFSRKKPSIDEVVRLAPWQKSKLERQTRTFSLEQLKQIYSKLYEIEIAQKTGDSSLSLSQNIDFLLLEM